MQFFQEQKLGFCQDNLSEIATPFNPKNSLPYQLARTRTPTLRTTHSYVILLLARNRGHHVARSCLILHCLADALPSTDMTPVFVVTQARTRAINHPEGFTITNINTAYMYLELIWVTMIHDNILIKVQYSLKYH